MEPLLKQLRELPARMKALSATVRLALGVGAAALVAAAVLVVSLAGGAERYEYAFTNLGAEDGAEAAATLKAAGVPFRVEAGGSALSVPAAKVYDARLLLAGAGLPRGGGVGFELFDRGDLGVSEFTQHVNLRRAIEGELARTIGHLSDVRSARVHVTIEEKGLYRDEGRKSSAAVVLNLQPGRTLDDRALAGIRHLVASSVPGLAADAVTIVDGRGEVLASESTTGGGGGDGSTQREIEHGMEQRLVALLEPVVGAGAVVAKVAATIDVAEVSTSAEVFDPDSSALRTEHKSQAAQSAQQTTEAQGGLAGAAGNVPPQPGPGGGPTQKSNSTSQDETRSYEINKTTTTTVARAPRLSRLSVAVLIDGVNGKPRPDEELARLSELAKRAVGLDEARGDRLELTSEVFARSVDEPIPPPPPALIPPRAVLPLEIGGGALLATAFLFVFFRGRRRSASLPPLVLRPGASVAELEGMPLPAKALAAPVDPHVKIRDRAREIARLDPTRTAHLLRAWLIADLEAQQQAAQQSASQAAPPHAPQQEAPHA